MLSRDLDTATSTSPLKQEGAYYVNVADRLTTIAERMPTAVAVATPGRGDVAGRHEYATCTFEELDQDATSLARGLVDLGVTPGTRMVLLVRPGVEFVKLVFALLRSGATTVLVDPGMGREHLVNCLAAAEPAGFVAISAVQAVRTVLRRRFPQAKNNVTVGRRWFWGGPTYRQLLAAGNFSVTRLPQTRAVDPAAIIFTSGSTGPPKGVLYTHQMFETQAAEIRREYDLQPGGADLACFALFGLFNSAMGVTTVFPRMDFSRPAAADPVQLLAAADDWRVTQAFASPAVWDKLSRWCVERGEQIPTLRKVFSCGAPVPAEVMRRTLACVSADAEMHTPYGATESLPVATISAIEVHQETEELTRQGAGVCVGRCSPTLEWRIIPITDGPIESFAEVQSLGTGEVGELVVSGPQVSPAYVVGEDTGQGLGNRAKEYNSLSKIRDGERIWHRMGDVGYLDEMERFWYCGRKNHRVETGAGPLFSVPCEEIFNTHEEVRRTALVGIGPVPHQLPILIVEPSAACQAAHGTDWLDGHYKDLQTELLQLAQQFDTTRAIDQVLFHFSLPVDVRHNAKINRELLAEWATQEMCTWPDTMRTSPYVKAQPNEGGLSAP